MDCRIDATQGTGRKTFVSLFISTGSWATSVIHQDCETGVLQDCAMDTLLQDCHSDMFLAANIWLSGISVLFPNLVQRRHIHVQFPEAL